MAFPSVPLYMQGGSYTATADRLGIQGFVSTGGVGVDVSGASPFAVTTNGTNLSIDVASGWAWIANSTANKGMYSLYNDGSINCTVTSNLTGSNRLDRVVLRALDVTDGGDATNAASVYVIAGGSVLPALPNNSISLASVLVPSGATTLSAGNIVDMRPRVTSNMLSTVMNGSHTGPLEKWNVSATSATSTVNIDITTAGVWYYTSDASGNFTLNVRGNSSTTLASMLSVGQAVTVVFACTNGATPYYANAFQVDGSSVTPKWFGSAPTAGDASSVDVYTLTVVKTAATPTYTVFAQMAKAA